MNLKKIEYILFFLGIILQAFAIFKVGNFNIIFIFVFSVFLFLKYNNLLTHKKKLDLKIALVMCLVVISFMFAFMFSEVFVITKILRLSGNIFIFVIYCNYASENIKNKEFINIAVFIIFFSTLYGVYQYFLVSHYGFPNFMNFTRTAHAVQSLEGGWSNSIRIYGTMTEPSFWGLANLLFLFILQIIKKEFNNKNFLVILKALCIFNIVVTNSRSAIISLLICVCFYLIFKILRWKNIFVLWILIIILPIINFKILQFANNNIFSDLSSSARSLSAEYYWAKLENMKTLFLGNGPGYVATENVYQYNHFENFAHNGLIEYLVDYGIITLFFLIFLLFAFVEYKNKNNRKISNSKIFSVILLAIFTTNMNGTIFYLESFMGMYGFILGIMLINDKEIEYESRGINNNIKL